jgi:L-2-hydroxyglutarate oxidase LhgO
VNRSKKARIWPALPSCYNPGVTDSTLEVMVIGAGVVGLAVGRALALSGREVVIVEAEPRVGTHTSSRNSEVIHAGIYYPKGSLKARLCVAGKLALYEYCSLRDVPHRRLGKIIVATRDDEIPALERLKRQAEDNGVTDLSWLSRTEVRDLEPAVSCVRGLLSPSTGIVDSHAFMTALRADAERAGAHVVLSTPVLRGEISSEGVAVSIGGREPATIECRTVVNAAGLWAQAVAERLRVPPATIPKAFYAKGHYFLLHGRSPFSRLVYPLPAPGGLGVHVTLDLSGQARFGPDVRWLDGVDYTFDESRKPAFAAAIRSYFPALRDDDLVPGYTGIRPKLGQAGSSTQDFVVQGPAEHGVPGLVNLYGIESPGLTAALALAEHVRTMLDRATAN